MIKPEYLHSDLTEKVIGFSMKVHRAIGKGFPEYIYQRALEIELQRSGIAFQREKEWSVYYEGIHIGKRRVDFIIEEKVLIELKALSQFESSHYNQIINYLQAFNMPVGLLINFGKDSLEFKRFSNNKYIDNNHATHT